MENDDFVVEDSPELRKILGDLDTLRLTILEGVAQRLGEDATLKQAIAFFKAPEPPLPKRRRRGKG